MCNAGVAAPKKGGRTMYAAEHKVEVTWSLTRELEFVPLCHATCNKKQFLCSFNKSFVVFSCFTQQEGIIEPTGVLVVL